MSDDELPAAIAEIRAALDPPGEDGVTFEAPWQARAFAIAVALRRQGDLDWGRFQDALVAELEGVESSAEDTYYRAWLRAIEGLLVEEGVVDKTIFAERVREFDRGERDASEFVIGDHGHHHDHDHPH